jgi:hypothetical protein
MAAESCSNCGFRKKYDERPKSILGRLWRFHANWCPGWKAYMLSLPEADRQALADKYGLKRFSYETKPG